MTRGTWKPKKGLNEGLIQTAKGELKKTEKVMQVTWKHVKGHSGDKWNDRADELADRGAEENDATDAGANVSDGEEETPMHPRDTTPLLGITTDRSEALRIMRSSTMHGTLNTSARRKEMNAAQIAVQLEKCSRRLEEGHRRGDCTATLKDMADTKLRSAAARLQDPRERRREREARKKDKYTTQIVSTVDMDGLNTLKREKGQEKWGGTGSKKTYGQTVDVIKDSCRIGISGATSLRLDFRHSALGRDMIEAGHITGSREYAKGVDPFKGPKDMHRAAWAKEGAGFDDATAYQRIKVALMPRDAILTRVFIEHRDTIVRQYGDHLFAEEGEEVRRKRMKTIINGFDMGSAETAWEKKFGNPYKRSLRGVEAKIPSRPWRFSIVEYRKEQQQLAAVIAQKAPAALEFVKHAASEKEASNFKTGMTLQSYVLQEAEAVARYHKLSWCEQNGREVLSLQHDGIIVRKRDGEDGEVAATAMTEYVRREAGFDVKIKHEDMQQVQGHDDEEEEWDMPPLTRPVQ